MVLKVDTDHLGSIRAEEILSHDGRHRAKADNSVALNRMAREDALFASMGMELSRQLRICDGGI